VAYPPYDPNWRDQLRSLLTPPGATPPPEPTTDWRTEAQAILAEDPWAEKTYDIGPQGPDQIKGKFTDYEAEVLANTPALQAGRPIQAPVKYGGPSVEPYKPPPPVTPKDPSSLERRVFGDPAVALARGVVGIPEAGVGLAELQQFVDPTTLALKAITESKVLPKEVVDVAKVYQNASPTALALRALGKPVTASPTQALKSVGVDLGGVKETIGQYYSPEQQEHKAAVHQGFEQGVLPGLKSVAQHPSVAIESALESLPLMFAGGMVGRAAGGAEAALAPYAAGIGEGGLQVGSTAAGAIQANKTGTLTPQQAALAVGSGLLTGVIGQYSEKIAGAIGIHAADVDRIVAGVATAPEAAQRPIARAIVESMVQEGLIEEPLQTLEEQIAQNLSEGKPPLTGMPEALVMAVTTGTLMGAGGTAYQRATTAQAATPPPAPPPPAAAPPPPAPIVRQGPSVYPPPLNPQEQAQREALIKARVEAEARRMAPPPPAVRPVPPVQPAAPAAPSETPEAIIEDIKKDLETVAPAEPVAPEVPAAPVAAQPEQPAAPPAAAPPAKRTAAEIAAEVRRRIEEKRKAAAPPEAEAPVVTTPAAEPEPEGQAPAFDPTNHTTWSDDQRGKFLSMPAEVRATAPWRMIYQHTKGIVGHAVVQQAFEQDPDGAKLFTDALTAAAAPAKPDKGKLIPVRREDGSIEWTTAPVEPAKPSVPVTPKTAEPVAVPEPVAGPVPAVTKSFKAASKTDGSSNALRFATAEEAEQYLHDLTGRWMGAPPMHVVESDDPVGHRWDPAKGVVYLDREKPTVPVTPKAEVAAQPTSEPEPVGEKPAVPVTPKTEAPGQSFAGRVYAAISDKEIFDALPTNAVALRNTIAKLVGHTEGDVPVTQMEDAIEGVLAERLRSEHQHDQPLIKQIEHANGLEARMPNAHRSTEKKTLQQFSTPLPIAVAAVHAARVGMADRILEPTAGTGNLLAAVHPHRVESVTAVEIDPARVDVLKGQGRGIDARQGDYLQYEPGKTKPTVIITNPPWGKYTTGKYGTKVPVGFQPGDVAERFVAKNLEDLGDGGRLVAVMPTTMLGTGSAPFRRFLMDGFHVRAIIQSPPKAYDTRGTTVDSVLLVVDKIPGKAGWPGLVTTANWEEYARAVEAIGERASTTAKAPEAADRPGGPRRPGVGEHGGKPAGGGTGDAKPGGSPDVGGGRDPDVVAGDRPAAPGPPGVPQETGAGGTAPGAPGAVPRPQTGAAPPGRTISPAKQALIDKLKARAIERTRPPAGGLPEGGGGEQGFAAEAQPGTADDLEIIIELLQQYNADGLVKFRDALTQLGEDFGDGWMTFKEELEQAWDLLKQEDDRLDEARPVDQVMNPTTREKIMESPDWRPYERRTEMEGAAHPKAVIEAKALAGVPYPKLTIAIPDHFQKAATNGWASVEQVEQALAAVQANVQGDKPHGFLIADAVGLGKSRELALTVNEFMREAQEKGEERRLIIVTKSQSNVADLLENFPYMWSGHTAEGVDLNTGKKDAGKKGSVPYGIVNLAEWSTSALPQDDKRYSPLPMHKRGVYIVTAPNLARFHPALAQLNVHGIVGDEAHELKNVSDTDKGKAWRGLHAQIFKDIPRSQQRFVYASATATQDINDYEYLYGMRLWPIDGFGDWVNLITGRVTGKEAEQVIKDADLGIRDPNFNPDAAPVKSAGPKRKPKPGAGGPTASAVVTPAEMEQIPRELKMLGRLSARDLWREGTEFEIHTATMPEHHVNTHDKFGELAREILAAVQQFSKLNKGGAAMSILRATSAVQFFAKRLALQSAMEEALRVAEEYVAQGFQPVLRVLNVSKVGATEDADDDSGLEETEAELGGHLAGAVNAINVQHIETDPTTGAINDLGKIPEALRVKARLMERARAFSLQSPVTMMEEKFGPEKVAAKIGKMNKAKEAAVKGFQRGERQVLLISSAGSTGLNLDHRVMTEPPAGHTGPWAGGRRVFIVVQFDWSASQEIQAIGRVDRASSLTPPLILPITFGNASEKRFLGVVANRLASTGATARGGEGATGAAKGYAEFESTGADLIAAVRDVWRDDTPDSVKEQFWGSAYINNGVPAHTLPDRIGVGDVQRALLYVKIKDANAFWAKVMKQREIVRARIAEAAGDTRTRARSGEVLRETELTPQLKLYEVKNKEGHRFGMLVGVIMPHMPRIRTFLPLSTAGQYRRVYFSFSSDDKRSLTGLEIPITKASGLAAEFGKDFGAEVLDTAEKVLNALRAGEKVPLIQKNAAGHRWTLTLNQDGVVRIRNAKMADEDILLNNGAKFRTIGQYFVVPQSSFEQFIERFPAAHPAELATEKAAEAAEKAAAEAEAGEEGSTGGQGSATGGQGYISTKAKLPPSPRVAVPPVNAKQLRPDEIIKSFEKMGLKFQVGGYRSKVGRLIIHGIFKITPEIVRTKIANDLPIASHEVGHYLDKLYGWSTAGARTPWNYELLVLGDPTSGKSFTQLKRRAEGVAEYTRLWLTNPQEAKQQAPRFTKEFERALEGVTREVMEAAQQQIHGIVQADPLTRLGFKIDMTGGTPNADTRTLFEKVHARMVNDLARVYQAVSDMGTPTETSKHAGDLAVRARSSASVADGFIKFGIKGVDEKFLSKGLEEILKPVNSRLDDFVKYVVALRARELAARGKETGIEPIERATAIRTLANEPEFEATRKELLKFTDAMLTYLHQHGILDAAAVTAMRDAGQFYVPLQRVMEGYSRQLGRGRQIGNRSSPLKRMSFHGSARTIINPLESIIRNVYSMVDVAMQNDAAVALVKQAEATHGSGWWLDRIATPVMAKLFNLEQIETDLRDQLRKGGVDLPPDINLNRLVTMWAPQTFADGNKQYMTVMRGGKRYFYQVNDKGLYDALTTLGPRVTSAAVRFLAPFAQVLRTAATTLNVTFGVRNPVRDTFVAYVQSEFGFKLGYDTMRGMYRSVLGDKPGDEAYKHFMTSGVMQASIIGDDRKRIQRSLRNMTGTEAREYQTRMKDTALTVYDALHAYIELGEKGTRYGAFLRVYEQELAKGTALPEAVARATMAARGSTVDFQVGGSDVRALNQVTAFVNARVRGLAQAANAFNKNPEGFVFRAQASITLVSAILWYLNHDDDDYDEIPDWEKSAFWHVPAPWTDSGFIRFPKPFELGMVFGTMFELALDDMNGKDPAAIEARFKELFGLNNKIGGPIGMVAELILMQTLPTAFVPGVEMIANYDTFRDRYIVSPWDVGKQADLKYSRWTPESIKQLAGVLHMSPAYLEHLIYGYTGGAGRSAFQAIDVAESIAGLTPKQASFRWSRAPGVGAFYREGLDESAASIQQLYRKQERAEGAKSSIAEYKRLGDTAKAEALEAKEGTLVELNQELTWLNRGVNELKEIRPRLDTIKANTEMTPADKRKALDKVYEDMVDAARAALGKKTMQKRAPVTRRLGDWWDRQTAR
jgi:Large polyvalent protein associated domain 38/C-terminal domain on Strawberry notch homologue/P-loop containing NTP hydrolase pore-1